MKILINLASAILQVLLIIKISSSLGVKRNIGNYIYPLVIFGYTLLSVVLDIFIKIGYVFTIIDILLWFACSCIYKIKLVKRVLGIAITYIFLMIAEMLVGLTVSSIFDVNISQTQNNIIFYLMGMLLSKALVFTVLTLIKPILKKETEKTKFFVYIPFLLLMIVSFYVIYLLSNFAYNTGDDSIKLSVIIGSILMLASGISALYIFELILKQEKEKRVEKEKYSQIETEKKYYANLLEKYNSSAKEMHDIKNKLFAIRKLLYDDFDKGISKINETCDIVAESQQMKYIGLTSVDALLFSKFEKIKLGNIKLNTNIFTIEKINIDEIDLCVILGNLLDNCYEGCMRMDTESVREVEFTMNQKNDFLNIIIKNTCLESGNMNKNFISQKKDKEIHGFGLANIEEMVSNYYGIMEKGVKDGMFCVNLIMKNIFPKMT